MTGKKNSRIKILIIDNHQIVHKGLKMLLGHEKDLSICGTADCSSTAINLIETTKPDIAVMDICLDGGVKGIEFIKTLRKKYPGLNILVSSMYDENLFAERAIMAGARGYIKKEELTNSIINAIRSIMDGKIFLSHKVYSDIIDKFIFDSANTNPQKGKNALF